jgi:hypothetical protein
VREKCFLSLTQFISIITKMTTLPIRDEISILLKEALENLKNVSCHFIMLFFFFLLVIEKLNF